MIKLRALRIPADWQRLPDVILVVLAAGSALLLAWSCGRGLDLFDESQYLLNTLTPEDSVVRASSAPQFLQPIFAAVGYNITLFRLLGLAALLLSNVFLSLRVLRLVGSLDNRQSFLSAWRMIPPSLLGSLLYYFWFIRSPSYNLTIVVISYLFTGFFIWALEAVPATRAFAARTACIGVLWMICLLVKFPTAFALFGLIAVTFLVWHGWSWRYVGRFAVYFAIGAAAFFAFYFIFVETPASWLDKTWGAAQLLQLPGFKAPPSGNLVRYLSQTGTGIFNALRVFWPAFAAIVLGFSASLAARNLDEAARRNTLGFLATLVVFTALALRAGFYGWQFTAQDLFYYYFIAAILVLLAIAGAAITSSRVSGAIKLSLPRRLSIIVALLLATPLAVSFGTSNPIATNALLAMGPWFVAMTILAAILSRQCLRIWLGPVVMLALGAMAFADVISGAIHPYGIYATIFQQTEKTELDPGPQSLKLDPGTSLYVTDLRNLANRAGITATSDVLFFYDSPGSVLVVGAHSPGLPWFFSESPESTLFVLGRIPRERLARAFIMIDLQSPPPPSLSKFGLNFPKDYDLVGEVVRQPMQHHVQLWRPHLP